MSVKIIKHTPEFILNFINTHKNLEISDEYK